MEANPAGRLKKILLAVIGGIVILCVGLLVVSALIYRSLPTQSTVLEQLSDPEKARLAEAANLRGRMGDQVWPGWEQQMIPFIVYNEKYAFLVGYPGDPPDGWRMMPSEEMRGVVWEIVPDDDFQGKPYYRQEIQAEDKTPENFTALVGDLWTATFMTKEYSQIAFVQGFGEQLPPFVRQVFPYQLLWGPLGGESGACINGLEHESFHSFQGEHAYETFAQSERLAGTEARYPWENEELEAVWEMELDVLSQAREVTIREDASELAGRFLELRDRRRSLSAFDSEMALYEQMREWLEGQAKYVELSLAYLAATSSDYEPLPAMAEDPDFKGYARQEDFYRQQFNEVARMSGHAGEIRFYYSGFAQGVLLDHLLPDWKQRAIQGETMETLLRDAVGE